MLDALYDAWDKLADPTSRPAEAVLLHQNESVTVYLDSDLGPPVPYPPAAREGGSINHGYMRIKGKADSIALIPEVDGWPEYQKFLRRLNAETSPIESIGCEKGFFPCDHGDAKLKLGSYTDIIYTNLKLNDDPRNFLRLADALSQAMRGSRNWWSIAEIGIQKSKGIVGCEQPWSLMLRVIGHGRDEAMARESWGVSIDRIGQIVAQLPPDFPISGGPD